MDIVKSLLRSAVVLAMLAGLEARAHFFRREHP
jgi:hypothetical protein